MAINITDTDLQIIDEIDLDTLAFSFDEIKIALQEQLKKDGVFTDYNKEGSNINSLVNILAYVNSLLNTNLSFMGNEQFLETASVRKNILKHAQTLGYRVQRKVSSKMLVDIKFTLENQQKLFLPKFFEFKVTEGDGTTFLLLEEIIIINNTGLPKDYSIEVSLKEGTVLTSDNTDGLSGVFDGRIDMLIPISDIEDDGIYLEGRGYGEDSKKIEFQEYKPTNDINITDVFNADIDENGSVFISLTNNIRKESSLNTGDTFEFTIITTKSFGGDGYTGIVDIKKDDINIEVSISDKLIEKKSFGGADEESSDSIKRYAGKFHDTKGKAITKDDWLSIVGNHKLIENSNIWGGEDKTLDLWGGGPVAFNSNETQWMERLGDVFISPKHSNKLMHYLNNNEMSDLIYYLKDFSLLGVRKNIVLPIYYHLDVYTEMFINKDPIYNKYDILSICDEKIQNYINEQFNFNRNFKISKLTNILYDTPGVDAIEIKQSFDKTVTAKYSEIFMEFNRSFFHTFNSFEVYTTINLPHTIRNIPLDYINSEYGNLFMECVTEGFTLEFRTYTDHSTPDHYLSVTNLEEFRDTVDTNGVAVLGHWREFIKEMILIVDTSSGPVELKFGEYNARWNELAISNNKPTDNIVYPNIVSIFKDGLKTLSFKMTNKIDNYGNKYLDLSLLNFVNEGIIKIRNINHNIIDTNLLDTTG